MLFWETTADYSVNHTKYLYNALYGQCAQFIDIKYMQLGTLQPLGFRAFKLAVRFT